MNRRSFLTSTAAALTAGACAPFAGTRDRFATGLDQVDPPGRADYSLAPDLTYFNHGSVGTVPKLVQASHAGYLHTVETNPWLYMWGGAWDGALTATRKAAASLLGCKTEEIVINRNTTDGFNLLAAGLPLERGDEVLFSNFNHAGASICWKHQAARRGHVVRHMQIPLARIGTITVDEIIERHLAAITARTKVLVLPHMDNMVGLRTPVAQVAKAARQKGVRFIAVDGAQVVGQLPVDVRELGVDVYCTSPHKWLQAPKGIGLMYIRRALQPQIHPHTVTWGQKRWQGTARIFEDYGTRDVPAVLALGDAIAFQQKAGLANTAARRKGLWQRVRQHVANDDRLLWRSPNSWELGGSLYAIEVKTKKSGDLAEQLWKQHKVVVRGFPGPKLNTLRLSLNAANTREEIDTFFDLLGKLA